MILCLDYGSRYVGVAISDDEEKMAVRHSVIDQKKKHIFKELPVLLAMEGVSKVLVGLPVSLSGNESEQTKETQKFITKLREAIPVSIDIETVDETLTSVEAEKNIKAEGANPNEAHAEAARIMLEDYLRGRLVKTVALVDNQE